LLTLHVLFSDQSQAAEQSDEEDIGVQPLSSSPDNQPSRGQTEDDEWEDIEETEEIGGE
jgi:hypothetical protein